MPLQWAQSLRTKLETSRGAGGTPVKVMTFTDAAWTPSIATISPEENRGSYFPYYLAVGSTETNTLKFGGDLDYSTAAWLNYVFVNGATSSTGGTSYTHAGTPSGTADNLKTVVAELGWVDVMSAGTPGVKLAYLGGDQLVLRWDKGSGRVTYEATLQSGTASADLTAFTGTPSSPAGTVNALLSVAGTQVYVDATTIGSTADPYIQTVEWTLNNSFKPLYTLNGSSAAQLVARPDHRKWTLRITRAYYNNNEWAVYKSKAERKIRVVTTGANIGGSGTPFKVQADFYAKAVDWARDYSDGFSIETISYEPYYDSAVTSDFLYTVVTGEQTSDLTA